MIVGKLRDGILKTYANNFLTRCGRNHRHCYFKYSKVVRKMLDDGSVELMCPKCGNGELTNGLIRTWL